MKNFVVNIGSVSNIIDDPDFFIGTGFMGESFNTYDELKQLVIKYAQNKDHKWKSTYVKFTFSLGTTTEAFINEGNRQCKENGQVNLLSAAAVYKRDPFRNITVVMCTRGWVDNEGNPFKFLIAKNDKDFKPFYGKKFIEVLNEIGLYL